MGYDLYGVEDDERYFRFNMTNFGRALRLSENFGWQAQGTTHDSPEVKDWDGGYFTNDGQIVSAEDCKQLADALEKAIPHLHKSQEYGGLSESDLEYHRGHLTKFVAFLRVGAFRIY